MRQRYPRVSTPLNKLFWYLNLWNWYDVIIPSNRNKPRPLSNSKIPLVNHKEQWLTLDQSNSDTTMKLGSLYSR